MGKIHKFMKSFAYASEGIVTVFRRGTHFRVMLLLFICAVILGLILRLSYIEFAIIILVSGLVLACEMFNTAFELIVDFVSPEKNPVIKKTKDIMAGASLIASITAFIVGIIIFVRHI